MGLWYPKDTAIALTAYADADHAGCQDTRRSTSGSAQFLEAEYNSRCRGCLPKSYGMRSTIIIFGFVSIASLCTVDNKSAIDLCCNNVLHSSSKLADINSLRRCPENGSIHSKALHVVYESRRHSKSIQDDQDELTDLA
ncbi:hypothetical protein Tco_0201285 [Tanacetum coccineum]